MLLTLLDVDNYFAVYKFYLSSVFETNHFHNMLNRDKYVYVVGTLHTATDQMLVYQL